MDWQDVTGRIWLERIVALLWSLAQIADLAVDCSPQRRNFLIAVLRRAEAAGLRAAGLTAITDAEIIEIGGTDDPDEARRLAVNLRAIAMMLALVAVAIGVRRDQPSNDNFAVPTTAFAAQSAPASSLNARSAVIPRIPVIDTS